MGGQRDQSRIIRKLQKACNVKFDAHLCYNINQWYSDRHKREINRYVLHKQVYDEATGKSNKVELFSTYSLLQMVFFMRDYWYMLNGIELPTDNEIWNEKRKGTILADGTTEGT